jgi:hypothetical protein
MEEVNNPAGRPLILQAPPTQRPTSTENRNKHLLTKATLYHLEDLRDELLWEIFWDDFDGWTINEFNDCDKITLCKFHELLRRRGIWVSNIPGLSPAGPLYDVLHKTTPTEWTE